MLKHYQNVHKLVGRNAILYKRNDVAQAVWYARFKIAGERRCVVRSSKTTDFAKATEYTCLELSSGTDRVAGCHFDDWWTSGHAFRTLGPWRCFTLRAA